MGKKKTQIENGKKKNFLQQNWIGFFISCFRKTLNPLESSLFVIIAHNPSITEIVTTKTKKTKFQKSERKFIWSFLRLDDQAVRCAIRRLFSTRVLADEVLYRVRGWRNGGLGFHLASPLFLMIHDLHCSTLVVRFLDMRTTCHFLATSEQNVLIGVMTVDNIRSKRWAFGSVL